MEGEEIWRGTLGECGSNEGSIERGDVALL